MGEETSQAGTAAAGAPRFAAFISYCHADGKVARGLQQFLETYRLPRDLEAGGIDRPTLQARLRPVFLDRADMAAATDLRGEIDAALKASRALVVICSPAAAKSRWVNLEIERFRQHHGDSHVFAVIIEGVAHASEHAASAERECFPPALRLRDTPDGPVRNDPAAVDLRRSGDGLQVGRLRLVAGLIGVPLDQLVHRDARRRHRRTLALVIGLALGLAATSALALYAIAARNEAQRQRFAAEGMIEFMIGDLRKTLEPLGRLSAMDPLGKKALDYYQHQDADALDADSLGRRARVLQLLGEIQDQRGNLDAALSNFRAAAVTTAELLERSPNDPKRIFDHAQSVYWVGYMAYRRGNYAAAEPAFLDYRRFADQLVSIEPANQAYQAEKGYAYSNLGTMLLDLGRNREAEVAFRQVLGVSTLIAKGRAPAAPEQYDLAQSHAWLADALFRQGKYEAAGDQRAAERTLLAATLAANPEDARARSAMVVTLGALSDVARRLGQLPEARALALEGAQEGAQIAGIDPTNVEAASRAAVAYLKLGEVALADEDIDAAAAAAAQAGRYTAVLVARNRKVAKWQRIDVQELLLRGAIAAARQSWAEAEALAATAVERMGQLTSDGNDASEARFLLNQARINLAEAQLARGDTAAAARQLEAVANDRAQGSDGDEPRVAALKARAVQLMAQSKPSALAN